MREMWKSYIAYSIAYNLILCRHPIEIYVGKIHTNYIIYIIKLNKYNKSRNPTRWYLRQTNQVAFCYQIYYMMFQTLQVKVMTFI